MAILGEAREVPERSPSPPCPPARGTEEIAPFAPRGIFHHCGRKPGPSAAEIRRPRPEIAPFAPRGTSHHCGVDSGPAAEIRFPRHKIVPLAPRGLSNHCGGPSAAEIRPPARFWPRTCDGRSSSLRQPPHFPLYFVAPRRRLAGKYCPRRPRYRIHGGQNCRPCLTA